MRVMSVIERIIRKKPSDAIFVINSLRQREYGAKKSQGLFI